MGISRGTARKRVNRWRAEGEAGLHDRSSRPHRTPNVNANAPGTTERQELNRRRGR